MSAGNSALGLMAGFSCTKKRSSNCAESVWHTVNKLIMSAARLCAL